MSKKMFTRRTLPMALAAVLAISPMQAMAASNDLTGHWAEKVITQWQDAGRIKGYADGTFKPNNSITRAEFVTVMNHALGVTEAKEISFTDVKAGDWYFDAVAKAAAAGYSKGYEDGTFKPNVTITRAEAAVMIANAAGLEADETGAAGFTDANAIPNWAKGSIGAVVKAGFMSGYTDGSFGAAKSITRAEAVSSLNRVMNGAEAEETVQEVPVVEDVTVTEDDTVIENEVIKGNLIIDEAVGEGEVYLNDVVVEGDIIVNGGGDDSIYLKNVEVKGKVNVQKKGVRLHMSGETKVPRLEVKEMASITSENFKGKVGTITINGDLGTGAKVVIQVAANAVVVDGKVSVSIEADVKTVEISKDAEGAKVEIGKGATVDTVVADAKATIAGTGKVANLEANVNGITVNKNLNVSKTETATGVSKPTTSGGSTSGGGSSSSGSAITQNKVTATADTATATAGRHGSVTITLIGATFKENLTNEELDSITADRHDGIGFYGFAGTGNILNVGIDAYQAIPGTYTRTISIPANILNVTDGYQIGDVVTVTVTVKVEANVVTAAELRKEVAVVDSNQYLATKEAAEAYMLDHYNEVDLMLEGETYSEYANIEKWTFTGTAEDLAKTVAASTEAVTLSFEATLENAENYTFADGVKITAELNITADQKVADAQEIMYAAEDDIYNACMDVWGKDTILTGMSMSWTKEVQLPTTAQGYGVSVDSVTWEITKGAEYITLDSDGLVTVIKQLDDEDVEIELTATLKYEELTGSIAVRGTVNAKSEVFRFANTYDFTFEQGTAITAKNILEITLQGAESIAANGVTVTGLPEGITYTVVKGEEKGGLNVTFSGTPTGTFTGTANVTVTIPAANITVEAGYKATDVITNLKVTVQQTEKTDVSIEEVSTPSEGMTFVETSEINSAIAMPVIGVKAIDTTLVTTTGAEFGIEIAEDAIGYEVTDEEEASGMLTVLLTGVADKVVEDTEVTITVTIPKETITVLDETKYTVPEEGLKGIFTVLIQNMEDLVTAFVAE